MIDFLVVSISAMFLLATAAYGIGRRHEAKYWVMHDGDGSVHHKGKFYLVENESRRFGSVNNRSRRTR